MTLNRRLCLRLVRTTFPFDQAALSRGFSGIRVLAWSKQLRGAALEEVQASFEEARIGHEQWVRNDAMKFLCGR
jgi:hypothetical protein